MLENIRQLAAVILVCFAIGLQLGQWGHTRKETTYGWIDFVSTVLSCLITLWIAGVI